MWKQKGESPKQGNNRSRGVNEKEKNESEKKEKNIERELKRVGSSNLIWISLASIFVRFLCSRICNIFFHSIKILSVYILESIIIDILFISGGEATQVRNVKCWTSDGPDDWAARNDNPKKSRRWSGFFD